MIIVNDPMVAGTEDSCFLMNMLLVTFGRVFFFFGPGGVRAWGERFMRSVEQIFDLKKATFFSPHK